MTQAIYFTRGIPASSKTTWAKAHAQETGAVRVSLDDLRDMTGDYDAFSPEREKAILKIQESIVLQALRAGKDCIIDATHLHPKTPKALAVVIWECGMDVTYHIQDFTDVTFEECLRRNVGPNRRAVPEHVLEKMHKILERERSKGLWTVEDLTRDLPKIEPYVPDVTKPPAILVDCDGTLANATTRGPYDFDRCGEDELWQHVKEFVNAWGWWKSEDDGNPFVIVMSGRDSKYRNITRRWLDKHDIVYDLLLMRPEGDTSRDSLTKLRLFNESVRNEYNVIAAWDDRRRVQRLWHQMGIPVVGCGGPDDDF